MFQFNLFFCLKATRESAFLPIPPSLQMGLEPSLLIKVLLLLLQLLRVRRAACVRIYVRACVDTVSRDLKINCEGQFANSGGCMGDMLAKTLKCCAVYSNRKLTDTRLKSKLS